MNIYVPYLQHDYGWFGCAVAVFLVMLLVSMCSLVAVFILSEKMSVKVFRFATTIMAASCVGVFVTGAFAVLNAVHSEDVNREAIMQAFTDAGYLIQQQDILEVFPSEAVCCLSSPVFETTTNTFRAGGTLGYVIHSDGLVEILGSIEMGGDAR